ncbi:unnamed protein product [Effrenium voratum]|nr:unnamed protein product [Effrenium voratum]
MESRLCLIPQVSRHAHHAHFKNWKQPFLSSDVARTSSTRAAVAHRTIHCGPLPHFKITMLFSRLGVVSALITHSLACCANDDAGLLQVKTENRPPEAAAPSRARSGFIDMGVAGPFPGTSELHQLALSAAADFEELIRRRQKVQQADLKARRSEDPWALGRAEYHPGAWWVRSSWAYEPRVLELASHPEILSVVTDLLGPNVMFYGAEVLSRHAGDVHWWHSDSESAGCNQTATVYLALGGFTNDNGLQVVTHSHQMGTGLLTKGLRPFMTKDTEHDFGARNFSIMGIELASEVSKELKVSAEAKSLHMADQDFVLFHGRAWHGTVFPKNESGERRVFLLQYATPSCQIRAPDAADRAENSPVMPITMMVSGTAQGDEAYTNNFVSIRDAADGPVSEWSDMNLLSGAGGGQHETSLLHVEKSKFSIMPYNNEITYYEDYKSDTPVAGYLFDWRHRAGVPAANDEPASFLSYMRQPRLFPFRKGRKLWEVMLGQTCNGHVMIHYDEGEKNSLPHKMHSHENSELVYVVHGGLQIIKAHDNHSLPQMLQLEPGDIHFSRMNGDEGHTQRCSRSRGAELKASPLTTTWSEPGGIAKQLNGSQDDAVMPGDFPADGSCGFYSISWFMHKNKSREELRQCYSEHTPEDFQKCIGLRRGEQCKPYTDYKQSLLHLRLDQKQYRNAGASFKTHFCGRTCSPKHGPSGMELHTAIFDKGEVLESHRDTHEVILIVQSGALQLDGPGFVDTQGKPLVARANDIVFKPAGWKLGFTSLEKSQHIAIELHHGAWAP